MHRRNFMKTTAIASIGAAFTPSLAFGNTSDVDKKVRIGLIAVGFRGQSHLEELLKRNDPVNLYCNLNKPKNQKI